MEPSGLNDRPVLVVQISDTHIVEDGERCLGLIDTATFLRAAVDTIEALTTTPDAVLITGDLVNEGRPAQYEHLRRLLTPLPAPWYLLPGNHDERGALRAAFPDHAELGTGPTCDFAVDVGPLRLVALDTLVDGSPGGSLSATQLAWLEARLGEEPERPTLLALHHPPFQTGIAHMDAMGLAPDAAASLARIVSRHPQVERVTSGHLHRAISRRWAGTVAATVPSVCHAVAFDIRTDGPSGWSDEPPAITLHHWHPDGGLVTHQLAIGDFPTRPFH